MPATTYRRSRRTRKSPAERQQMALEALSRARSNPSMANFGTVIEAFAARGIDPCDIDPKTNVFTYNAWRALGRQVRRGEKSVKITTFIPTGPKDEPTAPQTQPNGTPAPSRGMRPVTACVFHISQTDPIDAPSTPEATPAAFVALEADEHPAGQCSDPACEFCH